MLKKAENGQILLAVKYHYFGHFFWKCCHSKTNGDNCMKSKPNEAWFPKFSENVSSFFVSLMVIEIFKFENRTSDGEIFLAIGRDDSPVLSGPSGRMKWYAMTTLLSIQNATIFSFNFFDWKAFSIYVITFCVHPHAYLYIQSCWHRQVTFTSLKMDSLESWGLAYR